MTFKFNESLSTMCFALFIASVVIAIPALIWWFSVPAFRQFPTHLPMMIVISFLIAFAPTTIPFLSQGPSPTDFGCHDPTTEKNMSNSAWCAIQGVFLHWFPLSGEVFAMVLALRLALLSRRQSIQSQTYQSLWVLNTNKGRAIAVHIVGWIIY